MSIPDLVALVREAALEELPLFVGKLAEAQAMALARLAAPAASPSVAPATEPGAWVKPEETARCLNPDAVAKRLSLPVSQVYDLLRTGQLPGFKEGKYWLVPVAALEQHVREQLDGSMYRVYSHDHGRPGAPQNQDAAWAHAGGDGRATRRDIDQRRKVGAQRGADHRAHAEAHQVLVEGRGKG